MSTLQDAGPVALTISIEIAGPCAMPLLAALHGATFTRGWSGSELAKLCSAPGVVARIACVDDEPAGFLITRQAGDEAEILAIGVLERWRRRGIAGRLLSDVFAALRQSGIGVIYLEVGDDNAAALACYRAAGFEPAGRRPGLLFRR